MPFSFTLLTQNAYFGADLSMLLAATSPAAAIEAANEAWSCVLASDIPARAERIAEQIAAWSPDFVALQEVVQWYSGTFERMELKFDFLERILMSLRVRGVRYAPLAIRCDIDQTVPLSTSGDLVRLLDRHAVLFRVDPPSPSQPYNVQSATYSTLVPLPALGSVRVPRSWIAMDAIIGGGRFRLIESHLESYVADVQIAQAKEIIAGPARCDLPVVLAGDFNTNAAQDPALPDCTSTYPDLMAAGFEDVWSAVNPHEPGHTAVQAGDLRNQISSFNRRIDLILTRGGIVATTAQLVGATSEARTPSGLWPSDHAGVVARLEIASGL
jgi:endonuclease/exonuclease/phosphatase family metal-dependent hydrolase